jgi:CRISPR-associated endonuclease/helicase Cas3
LPDKGRVVVFSLGDDAMPPGAYKTGAGETRVMLAEGELDLNDPGTFDRYFRRLYANQDADAFHIQELRAERAYKLVDEHFRMIDDDTFPVLIWDYDDEATIARDQLLDAAKWKSGLRAAYRAIQPYVIAGRTYERGKFDQAGLLEEVLPGLWEWKGKYDRKLGLSFGSDAPIGSLRIKPEALFA